MAEDPHQKEIRPWRRIGSDTWKRADQGEEEDVSGQLRPCPAHPPPGLAQSTRRGGVVDPGRASQPGRGLGPGIPDGDLEGSPAPSFLPSPRPPKKTCAGGNGGKRRKVPAPRGGGRAVILILLRPESRGRGGLGGGRRRRGGPGRRLPGRAARAAPRLRPYKGCKSAQPFGMWRGPGGGAATRALLLGFWRGRGRVKGRRDAGGGGRSVEPGLQG